MRLLESKRPPHRFAFTEGHGQFDTKVGCRSRMTASVRFTSRLRRSQREDDVAVGFTRTAHSLQTIKDRVW